MSIVQKVIDGERLDVADALLLYDLDLFELGKLADKKRLELRGKKTFFNINRHINPTNI